MFTSEFEKTAVSASYIAKRVKGSKGLAKLERLIQEKAHDPRAAKEKAKYKDVMPMALAEILEKRKKVRGVQSHALSEAREISRNRRMRNIAIGGAVGTAALDIGIKKALEDK